jgi:DNA-binding MarR family transcriptional regulator
MHQLFPPAPYARPVADPVWLTEPEQRAWRGLLAMQARMEARLRRSLQEHAGLSDADYGVLVNLSEAPRGRLRPFELGRALEWEKSRLSHQLRRMEARGLLERSACDSDGRGSVVVLTRKGRAAIEAAAPRHAADVRRWFVDPLTPRQLDALTEITDAVLARLEEPD